MASNGRFTRARGLYQRSTAALCFKRPFEIRSSIPFISFTFDDFPRSALHEGGTILKQFGATGTYYASLGLMGTTAPAGPIFVADDLARLRDQGHELGCHTFDHCHSWDTGSRAFTRSIADNAAALQQLAPDTRFRTFSYPMSPPRPWTKRNTAARFVCCRGGGQTFNTGVTDLAYLRAYFLEKARGNSAAVKHLIDETCRQRGWLILATHDVCATPSPFGCTPSFFAEIVEYAVQSHARILPVVGAWEALASSSPDTRRSAA